MAQFAEFIPIILFFAAYQLYGIFIATAVLMGASVLQMLWMRSRGRKPSRMQVVSLFLVLILGGVTILARDEQFLKWKVSLVNWLFAAVFLASHFIGERTLIERMLAGKADFPAQTLRRLNASWAVFFGFMGGLNYFVMTAFDTETWVNFKFFGVLGLTIVFTLGQALYLGVRSRSRKPSSQ